MEYRLNIQYFGRGRSKAGGGTRGSGGGSTGVQVVNASGGAAQPIPATPVSFTQMSDKDASDLRQNVDDMYDPDVVDAIKLYISDSNPNGDGFSHSQNLNYKLDNGMPLNVTEQFIDDNIQAGMHDIGKDTQLTRFCHDDILQQCGISNYANMSEAQLSQQLVGMQIQTTSYLSTSYDASKSPFAPNARLGGGREVVMHVNAIKSTKMVFGARKQAEIVLNKGTKMRFTKVEFDGTTAHPRNKGSRPRVHIYVDTFD